MERTRKPTRPDIQRETIQILNADNWAARYQSPTSRSALTAEPLICWALVREGQRTPIVGIIAAGTDLAFADLDEDFIGYVQVAKR
jgi:hypothetical protein